MEVSISCAVLRPTGRGNGSLYQNYGDIDVLEAIDHVTPNYASGRDRITITGRQWVGPLPGISLPTILTSLRRRHRFVGTAAINCGKNLVA